MSIRGGMKAEDIRLQADASQKDTLDQALLDRNVFGALAVTSLMIVGVSLRARAKHWRDAAVKAKTTAASKSRFLPMMTPSAPKTVEFTRSFSADDCNYEIARSSIVPFHFTLL